VAKATPRLLLFRSHSGLRPSSPLVISFPFRATPFIASCYFIPIQGYALHRLLLFRSRSGLHPSSPLVISFPFRTTPFIASCYFVPIQGYALHRLLSLTYHPITEKLEFGLISRLRENVPSEIVWPMFSSSNITGSASWSCPLSHASIIAVIILPATGAFLN